MAVIDEKISDLNSVVTPAATDVFAVVQASGLTLKETRAQVHALESGEHLILPQVNEAATPTLAFGDGNSGFHESVDNTINISIAGSNKGAFTTASFAYGGAAMDHTPASATVPNLLPSQFDNDTGVGHRTGNVGVLIAGAQNCMEFGGVGAVPQVGFYGTAAISQQTGVTVDAAGIHAALVNLGLITA